MCAYISLKDLLANKNKSNKIPIFLAFYTVQVLQIYFAFILCDFRNTA